MAKHPAAEAGRTEGSSCLLEALVRNPLGSTRQWVRDPEHGWTEVGPRRPPMPMEYGSLEGTQSPADGEAVDVMIIGGGPTFPGCRYRVRPIGLLLRADGDHQVLAVPHTEEYVSPLRDIAEVDPELLRRLEAWFEPAFATLGWRDARWAEEWLGACRALAEESA